MQTFTHLYIYTHLYIAHQFGVRSFHILVQSMIDWCCFYSNNANIATCTHECTGAVRTKKMMDEYELFFLVILDNQQQTNKQTNNQILLQHNAMAMAMQCGNATRD